MERLTKKGFNFTTDFIKRDIDSWSIAQCIKKLQEYEDLDEQGLLLRLPFSKETPVYHIENKEVVERKLEHVVISLWLRETTDKDFGGVCFGKNAICVHTDDIGKTVYLTKAEAEQKLNEMESD